MMGHTIASALRGWCVTMRTACVSALIALHCDFPHAPPRPLLQHTDAAGAADRRAASNDDVLQLLEGTQISYG